MSECSCGETGHVTNKYYFRDRKEAPAKPVTVERTGDTKNFDAEKEGTLRGTSRNRLGRRENFVMGKPVVNERGQSESNSPKVTCTQ